MLHPDLSDFLEAGNFLFGLVDPATVLDPAEPALPRFIAYEHLPQALLLGIQPLVYGALALSHSDHSGGLVIQPKYLWLATIAEEEAATDS
jgi:hypothetical protein